MSSMDPDGGAGDHEMRQRIIRAAEDEKTAKLMSSLSSSYSAPTHYTPRCNDDIQPRDSYERQPRSSDSNLSWHERQPRSNDSNLSWLASELGDLVAFILVILVILPYVWLGYYLVRAIFLAILRAIHFFAS
jgi:hypothetical protein